MSNRGCTCCSYFADPCWHLSVWGQSRSWATEPAPRTQLVSVYGKCSRCTKELSCILQKNCLISHKGLDRGELFECMCNATGQLGRGFTSWPPYVWVQTHHRKCWGYSRQSSIKADVVRQIIPSLFLSQHCSRSIWGKMYSVKSTITIGPKHWQCPVAMQFLSDSTSWGWASIPLMPEKPGSNTNTLPDQGL